MTTPLLPPELAARAEAWVDAVTARVVARPVVEETSPTLIEGALGLAAFCGELAAWGRPACRDVGEAYLERAVELLNTQGARGGLHEGLAGLGFVVTRWYPQHAELLGVVDEGLFERLERVDPSVVGVGLRNGHAGLLRYALERGPDGQQLVDASLRALEALAQRVDDGLFWATSAEYAEGRGLPGFPGRRLADFGVAHGQAGVLHALAGVARLPGFRDRAAALLRPALRWLWNQAEAPVPEFARLWVEGGASHPLNENTWCTGNPGVAATAYHAAAALGDEALTRRALDLADVLARRILDGAPPGLPERTDLCCGMAGVAMLLVGLHEATGRAGYAEACARVAQWTLDAEAVSPVVGVGLQFGATGIALLLVSVLGGPRGWSSALCGMAP